MNKHGFLLGEETLKIIVALICIVLLIYFLTSLYYSKVNENKLKEAEATLKESQSGSIKVVIERVRNSQGNLGGDSEELLIHNPSGWYLFAFTEEETPNSCAGKNCLCICDKLSSLNFWEEQAKKCDEDGTCLVVEDLGGFDKIKIDAGTNLLVKKFGGLITLELK